MNAIHANDWHYFRTIILISSMLSVCSLFPIPYNAVRLQSMKFAVNFHLKMKIKMKMIWLNNCMEINTFSYNHQLTTQLAKPRCVYMFAVYIG